MITWCSAQEMANAAKASGGLVLKFAGTPSWGHFSVSSNPRLTAGRAVNCGKLTLAVIRKRINPALARYGMLV